MWNYVYYSNYLDSIDTSDHTAIQKYVYELVSHEYSTGLDQRNAWISLIIFCAQIDENKSDFFPKEKALCLGGEEDHADAQLEQIQDMIEDLLQRYRKKVRELCVYSLCNGCCVLLQDVTKSADARKAEQRRWEESVLRPKRTGPTQ